jgi:hypothetical protein
LLWVGSATKVAGIHTSQSTFESNPLAIGGEVIHLTYQCDGSHDCDL